MITSAAINTANYGMAAAGRRYDAAATRVAAPPAVSVSTTDVAADLVDATIVAPAAYGANAAMFRAADQTRGTLLDILA
jgi:hypothetical protein